MYEGGGVNSPYPGHARPWRPHGGCWCTTGALLRPNHGLPSGPSLLVAHKAPTHHERHVVAADGIIAVVRTLRVAQLLQDVHGGGKLRDDARSQQRGAPASRPSGCSRGPRFESTLQEADLCRQAGLGVQLPRIRVPGRVDGRRHVVVLGQRLRAAGGVREE